MLTIDRLYNSQRHMIISIIHIIRQYIYIVYIYMFYLSLRNRKKKPISDLILYFLTMYIYCVYTATACMPKIGKITHKKAKTCFMFVQVKGICWLYASSIQIKHRFIYYIFIQPVNTLIAVLNVHTCKLQYNQVLFYW